MIDFKRLEMLSQGKKTGSSEEDLLELLGTQGVIERVTNQYACVMVEFSKQTHDFSTIAIRLWREFGLFIRAVDSKDTLRIWLYPKEVLEEKNE